MLQFMRNMKVGPRIIAGFSLMILFMSIIGYTGYKNIQNIDQNLNEIFSVSLPSIDNLIEADRDLQQLLVAERSMIFSSAGSEIFNSLVKEYETNLKQSNDRWEKFKSLKRTKEEAVIISKYDKAREEWQAISRKVVDGRIADTRQGRREALDLTLGLAKEKFEQTRDYLDQLTEINLKLAENAREDAAQTYRSSIIYMCSTIGVGLLAGIFLMWAITKGVTKPLKTVIDGLTRASEEVSSASGQVSSSSQSLAEGTSEQAASVEETSSSLEEMSSMTRQNAEHAMEADHLVKDAGNMVQNANQSMVELTTSMNDISAASEETSKIIKTIDEIAFQTNLLALNAAVEAARAGEAGAGFAVVADEVRNLAMRAAEAARNTAELIEGTVKKVTDGSGLVTKSNDSFRQVVESVAKVGELVGEISAASSEQAIGIEQLNKAVNEMDKVIQNNAANAEESASASEEMNAQAEQMKYMVNDLIKLVGENGNGNGNSMGKIKSAMKRIHRSDFNHALLNEGSDGMAGKHIVSPMHGNNSPNSYALE